MIFVSFSSLYYELWVVDIYNIICYEHWWIFRAGSLPVFMFYWSVLHCTSVYCFFGKLYKKNIWNVLVHLQPSNIILENIVCHFSESILYLLYFFCICSIVVFLNSWQFPLLTYLYSCNVAHVCLFFNFCYFFLQGSQQWWALEGFSGSLPLCLTLLWNYYVCLFGWIKMSACLLEWFKY